MPRPLSKRVLVRFTKGAMAGAEKEVSRSRLDEALTSGWERVYRKKKTPPRGVKEPSADSAPAAAETSSPTKPADGSEDNKE